MQMHTITFTMTETTKKVQEQTVVEKQATQEAIIPDKVAAEYNNQIKLAKKQEALSAKGGYYRCCLFSPNNPTYTRTRLHTRTPTHTLFLLISFVEALDQEKKVQAQYENQKRLKTALESTVQKGCILCYFFLLMYF